MALPTYNETREQNTILATTQADITPAIVNNAINSHAGVSIFFGKLSEMMFGPVALNGKAKRFTTGESIETRVQLGKNDTAQRMASGYSSFIQDTQDTARVTRSNWKLYGATAIISGEEKRNNQGAAQISSLLEYKTRTAVESLVDLVAQDLYDNGSDATATTGLEQIISASDTPTLQGISGANYANWNSRGLSAKGTAHGSIVFTGASFATSGVPNWIHAFMNASEGAVQPEFLLTTEDVYRFYEGSLSPEIRYNTLEVGDGSFKTLTFKGKPVFHDSYCGSGITYFINTDFLYAAVSPGADFQLTPMQDQQFQDVFSSKVLFQGNFVSSGRKFQNKVDTQTA